MANISASADHLRTNLGPPFPKLTDKRLAIIRRWLTYPGPVVYFVGPRRGDLVKIGFASDLGSRLRHLQTGSPVELHVLAAKAGRVEGEYAYHQQFSPYRVRGEWFQRSHPVRAEMARLQELGPPGPSEVELAQRAANIKAYWREQMRERRQAQVRLHREGE